MRLHSSIILLLIFCLARAVPAVAQGEPASADVRPLEPEMRHVRSGDMSEWAEFAASIPDSALVVSFEGAENAAPAALQITQYDVRREWRILLNGVDLGALEMDEQRMTVYRDVPAGTLVDGKNELLIASTSGEIDDIAVGRITLHRRSKEAVLSDGGVTVYVTDKASTRPLPARITIVNHGGALQTVGAVSGPSDHKAVRPGAIYSGDGTATFRLPVGRYTIYASRGFEYGADSVHLAVKAGTDLVHQMEIGREVPTDGWIAMDPHVHTLTHSGHGDATAAERVVTLAAEGVELPVITDHNKNIDLSVLTTSMGYDEYVVPITGNEYTTSVGHYNVFPVGSGDPVPDPEVMAWPTVASELGSVGPPEAVILNHARDLHAGFRPFGPKNFLAVVGRARGGESLPANAMEVVNSSAQQSDVLRLVRDWFGNLNAGRFLTPVGSSDSHDVARYLVGQGRTYVRSDEDAPPRVDVPEVIRSFVNGEAVASFGLMPTFTVEGAYGPGELAPSSSSVRVDARVLAPSWIEADHVALYMNGTLVREDEISASGQAGEKWSGTWTVELPPHDVFLSVVALGPGDPPPFWPIPKPYQRTSLVWKPHVVGVAGAVWVDVDGDGRPTPARVYAERLVDDSGSDMDELIRRLSTYDEAVAAQAAAELHDRGLLGADFRVDAVMGDAPTAIRRGFQSFVDALQL